jgi:multiple sugar transport system permease protein
VGSHLPKRIALAAGLLVLAVLVLLPFYWIAIGSLKPPRDIIALQPTFVPLHATLDHYVALFRDSDFPVYLRNSVIVASGSMVITVVISVMAAYAFLRLRFRGRDALFKLVLVVYAFPGIIVLIPLYGLMSAVGLIDTLYALIIVNVTFATPFAVWMMRSFLAGIPAEMEEAAAIDGASRLQTMRWIMLPLVAPGVASIAIFAFISSWTEYVFASVLIVSDNLRTIPVGLAGIVGQYNTDWGLLLAGATLTALPVMLFFLAIGHHFIEGLTEGMVK